MKKAKSKKTALPSRRREKAMEEKTVPIARTMSVRNTGPRFSNGANGSILVSHRELIKDVAAGGLDFDLNYLEVNPGLYSTFPWLSGLATRFEFYRFHKLAFEYVPHCSSLTQGSMVMALDYDVSDYGPNSAVQMQSYQGSTRTSVWQPAVCFADSKFMTTLVRGHMIRNDEITAVDPKLYDAACFYYAPTLCVAATAVGTIWADYVVELIAPNMEHTADSSDAFKVSASGVGVDKNHPLETGTVSQNLYEPTVRLDATGTNLIIDKIGDYLMQFNCVGTGLNATGPDLVNNTGHADTVSAGGIANAAATTGWYDIFTKVDIPGSFTLAIPAAWATLTANYLRGSAYPKAFA